MEETSGLYVSKILFRAQASIKKGDLLIAFLIIM
jgi:hypothetical protein